MSIKPHTLPTNALLQTYTQREGCFTDCYATEIPADISLKDYIAAFYTTPLFKVERLILKLAANAVTTDEDAVSLANAETAKFAIWAVEGRTENQLLLCDNAGATRSWLMTEPISTGTRLYFGSAVVPKDNTKLGFLVHALTPFHKLYSRGLLASAKRRLTKTVLAT